ncbi:MAG TPA: hypothetical protein VJ965_02620, partial [Anaerolineales bacterium]|nr:hypothetical protein [Anaerolineales bacterium]
YAQIEEEVREVLGMPKPEEHMANYPWTRPCLVGVAAREGGDLQDADFEAIVQARLEAVKVNRDTSIPTINRLRETSSEIFLLAQIFHLLGDGVDWSAAAWIDAVRQDLDRLYRADVRYFELQRLPNIQQFGWNRFWYSGEVFGEWWLEVFQTLRGEYPEARFGFPGVMPGGQVPGRRLDAQVFLDGADPAMLEADWLGAVCYWNSAAGRESEEEGRFYEVIRRRYPEKLLFITEFGNTNQHLRAAAKGEEYQGYYQRLREVPGIGAAFAQVVSSASGYDALVWRSERGELNEIALQVGKREN